jgi:hypothetical protein
MDKETKILLEYFMLEKSVIITLIVYAIYASMWGGMIFSFISRWLSTFLHPTIQKPLYSCPACMAIWYGTAIYWIVWANSWQEWAICVLCAMGQSAIIISFLPKD